MTLGQKIKELRESRGWTQEKLAERSGLGGGHISRLESDGYKNPSANTLLKIARALRVNPSTLYHAAGYTSSEKKDKPQSPQEILEDCLSVLPVAIPVVSSAHAMCTPTETIDYAYWAKEKAAGRNILGVIVKGFCLSPLIEEGDIIFIDSELSAHGGDIVLAVTAEEVLLGRFQQIGDRAVLSTSERLVEITEDCVLKGVVIEVNRKVRR